MGFNSSKYSTVTVKLRIVYTCTSWARSHGPVCENLNSLGAFLKRMWVTALEFWNSESHLHLYFDPCRDARRWWAPTLCKSRWICAESVMIIDLSCRNAMNVMLPWMLRRSVSPESRFSRFVGFVFSFFLRFKVVLFVSGQTSRSRASRAYVWIVPGSDDSAARRRWA